MVSKTIGQLGKSLLVLVTARTKRLSDEQEHRQKMERSRAKAELELLTASKLEDVLGVLIADRSMSDSVREQLDRIHPPPPIKVRVDDPDDPQEKEEVKVVRKSKRRNQ